MAVTYASNVFTVTVNTSTAGTGAITSAPTTVKLGAGTFGAAAITGTGTTFTTQLRPGSIIVVSGISLLIHSIQSNLGCIAFKKDNADSTYTLATATAFTFQEPTVWSDMLTAVAGQAATIAQGNVTSINFVTASVTINSNAVFMLDDFSTLTFGTTAGYRVNNNDGFLVFRNGGAMTYTGNVQYSFFNGFLNVWNGELVYTCNSPGGAVRQDFFAPSTKSNGMSALALVYAGGTASANAWFTHLEPLAGKFGSLRFSNETRVLAIGANAGINAQFGNGTYANVALPSKQSSFGIAQNVYIYLARSGGQTVLTNPVLPGSTLTITGDGVGSGGTASLVDETWKDLAAGTVGTISRDSVYPGSTVVTRIFTYFPGTFYNASNPVYLRIANASGTTAINGAVTSAAGILLAWQTFAAGTNVTTNFGPFSLTARRKDIAEITQTFTPTAPITYINPLVTDSYYTSDASSQTGITINGSTKIIDVGTALNADRLYDYLKYFLTQNLATPNFLSPTGKELELLSTWTATQVNNLTAATKLTSANASTAFTASGALSTLRITGNVTQATPTNLTNVSITGSLSYNSNTAITVTFTSPSQVVGGTISNSGTGLVTALLAGGATVGTVGSNVTTQIVTALNLTGLTAGSQIYVSNGVGSQVAYVASSGTTYTLDTTGGTGTWRVKVAQYGFTSKSFTFTPATSDLSVSVSLIADAFITQATKATVAAYTTLQNPDRIYDYAAYFETTNSGIPLARIAAKQGTNVSLGAYDVTMTAATAFDVTGNMVTLPSTAAFVGGVTMTGGLTTSGNVTLNAQATAAGTYAPISANNIALSGLPNYQTLSAITAVTGLPSTGTVSAAGSLGLGTSSTLTATGDIALSGTSLSGALAVSKATEAVVTLTDCTGAFTLTKGGVGAVKAVVSGVTQRPILPATLPTGVSLFALCSVARFGGGAFNLVARAGTTGAFTDFGYSTGITSKNLIVEFGQPVELAMWTLGYLTYVRTLSTSAGGFAIQADMVTEPDVDTALDVSGYLANITVSNAGGVFTVIFGADMAIPGLEQAKAIVHRLLALENAMRALLPPGSSTIIDIEADEIQINQPGVFLTLGTGVNSVEIAGYFNTLPAKAINSAYVLNPRRAGDNLRVEIPLVKPAIDAALLASAVRTELNAELAQVTKVAKLHGIGASLVVTPSTRVAGTVSQRITTEGTTTTVAEV